MYNDDGDGDDVDVDDEETLDLLRRLVDVRRVRLDVASFLLSGASEELQTRSLR